MLVPRTIRLSDMKQDAIVGTSEHQTRRSVLGSQLHKATTQLTHAGRNVYGVCMFCESVYVFSPLSLMGTFAQISYAAVYDHLEHFSHC